ncbi:hypothetical protein MGYG_05893 [Nannizzia gypsea CBS 118893]|uniref:Uncharacterized protein n=1 Tax=Arthroderma gypseum (strain ATCC MYA-4604 / CBS 118893) TaxID=535722 RepID=E4UZV5_ARTGP|nr:hypothetical protein MGYG_05893 [Nannizzia gypsea CBS 118893]EFR02892.1 hypothetical protein MGYG_05893 [Nannizzia gypsea CBS 118893]
MRFENWDVLLFPEGSKVPVQEFKTNCFVTRDHESPYLQAQAVLNPGPYYSQTGAQGNPGQLPVLTCFLPSLPRDAAFRVSIHSWTRPRPTRVMEGLMQPEDSVMFEVRIFIDGICASASLFNQQTPWPYVIELDRNGNQDNLRFPMFHEELLHQAHWDAGDMYGRIRVVIAEGFTRPLRNPPFERVRDLIAFSYQHAPLAVLESSGIAWPNPGMWQQQPVPALDIFSSNLLGLTTVSKRMRMLIRTLQPAMTFPVVDRDGHWIAPPPQVSDPFVDPSKNPWPPWPFKRRHSTLDDISMPDYIASSSSSSRVISNTAGLSFSRNREPAQLAPMDDERYNQLIKAMSPSKATKGTSPPMNTPMAAKVTTKAPFVRKEVPVARDQESVQRSQGAFANLAEDKKSLLSPSPNVRGRKEGSLSVYEDDKENSSGNASPAHSSRKASLTIEAAVMSVESKRKRSVNSIHSRGAVEAVSPSSSKKISRRKRDEQLQAEFEDFLSAAAKTDALLSEVELE